MPAAIAQKSRKIIPKKGDNGLYAIAADRQNAAAFNPSLGNPPAIAQARFGHG